MTDNLEIIIGHFFPQPAGGSRVFASVYATYKVQLKVTIEGFDQKKYSSQQCDLEKDGDAIELDIQDLPKGNYRVLIAMGTVKWVRKLQIIK